MTEKQSEDSRKGGQNDPNRAPKAPDPTFSRQSPSVTPAEKKPDSPADLKR